MVDIQLSDIEDKFAGLVPTVSLLLVSARAAFQDMFGLYLTR